MDRTIISWNAPNFVSIGLMALLLWGGFLLVSSYLGRGGGAASNTGGY